MGLVYKYAIQQANGNDNYNIINMQLVYKARHDIFIKCNVAANVLEHPCKH